jgi:Fur family ferric uptake transcriptional regulator/Fur family peroxide stress response transcriptional regulator
MAEQNEIVKRLKDVGIRPSVQRVAIAQYLAQHRNHPTVDDIYSALRDEYPTLSRTTVYNTVTTLADSGVILSLSIDQSNARYDYDISVHAHFRCRKCGKVVDLEMPKFEPITPEGLQVDAVKVYYEGLCAECSHQSK